jgi:hypothetical protein
MGATLSCIGLVWSYIPSAMLEHEAQMFGFRDKAFPASGIDSPQQMQIRGFIASNAPFPKCTSGMRKWRRTAGPEKYSTCLPDAPAL